MITLASRVADCAGDQDPDQRLRCYDSQARRATSDKDKPAFDPVLGWKLRDEVGIGPTGKRTVGKLGAKLGGTDESQKESSKVALAALYVWDNHTLGSLGDWQPFAGLGWARDTSAKEPSDKRSASIGAKTSFPVASFVAAPTLLLTQRHELYTRKDVTQVTANADVLIDGLQGRWSVVDYDLVPVMGLNHARNAKPAEASTQSTGAYLGGRFVFGLTKDYRRWSLEGYGQWFRNVRAPEGEDSRTVRYGTLSIVYNLGNPDAKTGWVPAITVSGERGTEPVRGKTAVRKYGVEVSARFD